MKVKVPAKSAKSKQPERQEANQDGFGTVEVRTIQQKGDHKSARKIQRGILSFQQVVLGQLDSPGKRMKLDPTAHHKFNSNGSKTKT